MRTDTYTRPPHSHPPTPNTTPAPNSRTRITIGAIDARAELCKRHFEFFVREFWGEIIPEPLVWNWHMEVLCWELQVVAERVFKRAPKLYDLIINIPPGTTKSTIATIMFPVWCWTRDPTLKFISGSYSADLSLEHSQTSRDIIRSDRYQRYFPEITLRADKDLKSNYQNTRRGTRFSTSVGGSVTGMHGHMIIIDDPLNPKQAVSEQGLKTADEWMSRTLSTRKINKRNTPTILIMQRLHQKDPTGEMLKKRDGVGVRHICLPGEIFEGAKEVKPPELAEKYVDGMLDPNRMPREVLKEMQTDLGQYGYAGQVKQRPTPAGGGMFKIGKIEVVESIPGSEILQMIRYWDKAATDAKENPGSARTAGVKMALLKGGKFLVMDVRKGQWGTDEREEIIKQTAQIDGQLVQIWIEQEPGSGGKDSARATVKNLAGFSIHAERPTGDKIFRADPFSVQVNWSNVLMLRGAWNQEFLDELEYFPVGGRKDQVDAASGAFNKLQSGKRAGAW